MSAYSTRSIDYHANHSLAYAEFHCCISRAALTLRVTTAPTMFAGSGLGDDLRRKYKELKFVVKKMIRKPPKRVFPYLATFVNLVDHVLH